MQTWNQPEQIFFNIKGFFWSPPGHKIVLLLTPQSSSFYNWLVELKSDVLLFFSKLYVAQGKGSHSAAMDAVLCYSVPETTSFFVQTIAVVSSLKFCYCQCKEFWITCTSSMDHVYIWISLKNLQQYRGCKKPSKRTKYSKVTAKISSCTRAQKTPLFPRSFFIVKLVLLKPMKRK